MTGKPSLLATSALAACVIWPTVSGPRPGLCAEEPGKEVVHFNLLGTDWARIPEGHSGIAPMKVVAELNIPKEYLMRNSPPFLLAPRTENESSIPLVFLFPSLKAGEEGMSPGTRVYAIIDGSSRDERSRRGVMLLLSRLGMERAPRLDVDGLCGYVDEYPGTIGQEFYSSCHSAEQTFFITCFPEFNYRRSCSETAFLAGEIGAELTYQHALLKDHANLLKGLTKLISSFIKRGIN